MGVCAGALPTVAVEGGWLVKGVGRMRSVRDLRTRL